MAVPSLKYLEHILSSSDDYLPAEDQNIRRAQGKWGQMVNILYREGENRRMAGRFYVVVVQVVILFGSEPWVTTPRLEKVFTGLQHRSVRRMAVMIPEIQLDEIWLYEPIGEALEMVVLYEIGVYISHLQNTMAKYIATRPIVDMCLAVEMSPGMRLSRRW